MDPSNVIGGANTIVVALTASCAALAGLFAAVVLMLKNFAEMNGELGRLQRRFQEAASGAKQTNLAVALLSRDIASADTAEAVKGLDKPDPALVFRWAEEHHATNAWDMGPRNWERCLHDLGYGGFAHELVYNADGTLQYQ